MSKVRKHILNNGLTVLLKEVHSAPVISWWMLYRVGSRNERSGHTGISHWVEHMMFKGTPRYPAGVLDREIDRLGGMWNAQTATDYTAFFATLPADQIELALDLEADRMVNAAFDPHEVESERTVIIAERQGAENMPLFWLNEEVTAAAFRVHGYRHDIIGDMVDLHTMTRDDLYGHYRAHYRPAGAIAVAVGAFDSDALLRRIEAHYGHLPADPPPRLFVRPEPPQQGERRVIVERPGTTAFLQMVYRAPPATDPDWFALALIDSVLTGPGGPGSEEIANKTCRLYRALVETEIAASVTGDLNPTIDPFLWDITLTLRDGRTHEEAEAILDDEIARMRHGGITEAELQRARKQARALFAYSTESVTDQGFWLALAEHFGSYTWFEDYVAQLEAVTLDDVHAAANHYLRPQNRVVGYLIPTGLDLDDMDDDDDD